MQASCPRGLRARAQAALRDLTDWRLAANDYFTPKFGLGFQYKYNHFRQDKGALDAELSGEIGSEGPQAYLTFRF